VYGPAATKPIGPTYPERRGAPGKNGSTEVLEMEEKNRGKGKVKQEWGRKRDYKSRSEKRIER
jgi:hypothetical protein